VKLHGYLCSTPTGSKQSRFDSWVAGTPPLGDLFYLWDWLQELGVIIGGREVSYVDVKAWSELIQYNIQPDEARAMCELSRAWLNEYRRGTDPDSIAPWFPEV
jgi:hypothetical protein